MSDESFEGTIPVQGGTLWAQWAGSGSAVVLIHAGIADARMWDPQWDTLVSPVSYTHLTLPTKA